MPEKILIVNIFGIGDVLFTTPLITNLKEQIPGVSIGFLANRRTAGMLQNHPDIDKVFVYERDEYVRIYRESRLLYIQRIRELIRDIKRENYTRVLDVSLNTFMGFLTWAARIPERIGYDYKRRGRFLTRKIPLKGYERRHVVSYYLDLLPLIGLESRPKPMALPLSREDRDWAEDYWRANGLNGRKCIGLVPGGGASWGKDARYKRWPLESWAKLADKIVEKSGAQIILMGDASEHELCMQAAHLMHQKPLLASGKTSLPQFAALSRRCDFIIVNDGGPLHAAAASGAKTVSVFGPVDEKVYGPYPEDNHSVITGEVLCRPCYHYFRRADCPHISCLNRITVDDVVRKVEEIV